MLFVYLLVCRNNLILAHVYFRFIKVNFPFTNGEGERRKLSFLPTVDFCLRSTTSGTHFDPHNTHSLRHMTQRMIFQRPREAEKRDPRNEVAKNHDLATHCVIAPVSGNYQVCKTKILTFAFKSRDKYFRIY